MKPEIANRFSNGVYTGAKGFDVDPPPSYIDYSNNSANNNSGDQVKGHETKKWNIITSDEESDDKDGDKDEKSVEIKSVPFLRLVSIK